MLEILRLSIKDFCSKKYILMNLIPFLIAILVFGVAMVFGLDEIFAYFTSYIKSLTFMQNNPTIANLIDNLIKITLSIGSIFLIIILSIITTSIAIGFMTPIVTKDINLKYYQIPKTTEVGSLKVFKISIFDFLKFLGIFLISLPFLFIPIINLFILNIPFFYLFYKFFLIDIASNALNSDKFLQFYKRGGGISFVMASACFFILSLIPILGILLQLFFVIYLSHLTYRLTNKGE